MTTCRHGHAQTPENVKVRANGWRTCRACQRERERVYKRKPESKAREQERTRRYADRRRDVHLQRMYGLTQADVERMHEEQGGRCAICSVEVPTRGQALAVDHCHATGVVRGLLCQPCNRALGLMVDDPERLRRAADYVLSAGHVR